VFLFKWAKYGIDGTVYRVGDIDYGDLTSSQIVITALEDAFGFEDSVYTVPVDSLWTDGRITAEDLTLVKIVEATYWDIVFGMSAANRAQLQADYGFIATLAARPVGSYYSYNVNSRVSPADYSSVGDGSFAPTAIITPALTQEVVSSFDLTDGKDLSLVSVGHYAYIDDEIVGVTAIDIINNTVTVNRGVLDTVPVVHEAGSRLWFAENHFGNDDTEWSDADIVCIKLTPVTGLGSLPIDDASERTITLTNRAARPYPPANVTINGERYPAQVFAHLDINWSHRDRLLQTAYLVDQTAGDIGAEPSTTYSLRLYSDATLLISVDGVTGTSHSLIAPSTANKLELFAVRDGLESWQRQAMVFSVLTVTMDSTTKRFDSTTYTMDSN
jgi:hypothetical protein